MFLYDTHMHTKEGSYCGKVEAAEKVRDFKALGYTGIIITDHLRKGYDRFPPGLMWEDRVNYQLRSYHLAREEGKKCGLDVFLGWEFAPLGSSQCDILTYGLGEKFLLDNPNVMDYSLAEYSEKVRAAGGYLAQAHPFRNATDDTHISPTLLDGMEVFNSCDSEEDNARAWAYATAHALHKQAGSDSHYARDPAKPCGIRLKTRATSIFDIINAIRSGVDIVKF